MASPHSHDLGNMKRSFAFSFIMALWNQSKVGASSTVGLRVHGNVKSQKFKQDAEVGRLSQEVVGGGLYNCTAKVWGTKAVGH